LQGPYDVAIGKVAEANLHFAEKDKEREMEATDQVFEHDVETDVDRKKKIITAQSEYDLERHSYD